MTLYALLSDVHGRGDRLARVLADARRNGAVAFLALGDIASTHALDLLDEVGAECVFGNWEASGLRGLPPPYRGWVNRWPAQVQRDGFIAAHASPMWPDGLEIGRVVEYLRAHGLHWTALFPSLLHSEDARWQALAELESADLAVFFHGHTHVQEAWCWRPGGVPLRVTGSRGEIEIAPGERWLVGVGSVGDPHDGPGACYALYDAAARRVLWRRV
ncbi:MAG: metallophosphatase family protein [Anaerolineae bacterium]|nr:metallophosphatase family protein [Anaerolineae bacterium]